MALAGVAQWIEHWPMNPKNVKIIGKKATNPKIGLKINKIDKSLVRLTKYWSRKNRLNFILVVQKKHNY